MGFQIAAERGKVLTEANFQEKAVPDRSSRVRKSSVPKSFGTDTRDNQQSFVLRSERFDGLVDVNETGQVWWGFFRETLEG